MTDCHTDIDELIACLERFKSLADDVREAGEALIDVLRRGGKVMTAGNGGSAADALHLAEELVGRFKCDRRALAAMSLAADPTLLTCIGNDFGFEKIFSRQVEALGGAEDALVVFSTSGNSANLINALKTAQEKGLLTIALLGQGGGKMKGMANKHIIVPSETTARIQEVHTLILHSWLAMAEAQAW